MTREEAIKILEQRFDSSCRNNLFQNVEKLDYEDALWMAISALRSAPQPGKPLTLDQLREMDGEPVYDYLVQEWYVIQEYSDHELTMTDGTRFLTMMKLTELIGGFTAARRRGMLMANKPVIGYQLCPYCGGKVPVIWDGNRRETCMYCKKRFQLKRQKLKNTMRVKRPPEGEEETV